MALSRSDKELLLKDLSARLPYGVKVLDYSHKDYGVSKPINIGVDGSILIDNEINDIQYYPIIDEVKPYLRSMSSMSEEEFVYFMGLRGRMLQFYEIQSLMKEAFNMPQFLGIATTLGSYSNKIDWLF